MRLSIATWPRCEYESIHLVHRTLNRDPEPFFERAREALELIKSTDPSAWQMVKREIRHIVNVYMFWGGGEYVRWSRVCSVDFDRSYKTEDPNEPDETDREWYVAALAGTIVHEATHGRIFTLGVPYNRKTWERIERLCMGQMRRFLARLKSENYDLLALAPAFDAAAWLAYRNPALWRDLKRQHFARLLPVLRAYWKKQ